MNWTRKKRLRYAVLLSVLLLSRFSSANVERWCRCTLLDHICCIDVRSEDDEYKSSYCQDSDKPCLCTNRTHFLNNPFFNTHPYFLTFSNMSRYPDIYNQTPNLIVGYDEHPADFIAYPNLLEDESNLRLLTELRRNVPSEVWSNLHEHRNERYLALLMQPKSYEILVALNQAGVITNISNLADPRNFRKLSDIPYPKLINNLEFFDHYDSIKNESCLCRKLRRHDNGSGLIPGLVLGLLIAVVAGCFLVCIAFQHGLRKDRSV